MPLLEPENSKGLSPPWMSHYCDEHCARRASIIGGLRMENKTEDIGYIEFIRTTQTRLKIFAGYIEHFEGLKIHLTNRCFELAAIIGARSALGLPIEDTLETQKSVLKEIAIVSGKIKDLKEECENLKEECEKRNKEMYKNNSGAGYINTPTPPNTDPNIHIININNLEDQRKFIDGIIAECKDKKDCKVYIIDSLPSGLFDKSENKSDDKTEVSEDEKGLNLKGTTIEWNDPKFNKFTEYNQRDCQLHNAIQADLKILGKQLSPEEIKRRAASVEDILQVILGNVKNIENVAGKQMITACLEKTSDSNLSKKKIKKIIKKKILEQRRWISQRVGNNMSNLYNQMNQQLNRKLAEQNQNFQKMLEEHIEKYHSDKCEDACNCGDPCCGCDDNCSACPNDE